MALKVRVEETRSGGITSIAGVDTAGHVVAVGADHHAENIKDTVVAERDVGVGARNVDDTSLAVAALEEDPGVLVGGVHVVIGIGGHEISNDLPPQKTENHLPPRVVHLLLLLQCISV